MYVHLATESQPISHIALVEMDGYVYKTWNEEKRKLLLPASMYNF